MATGSGNLLWAELRGKGAGAGKASDLTRACNSIHGQELCARATKELEKSKKFSP